MGRSRNVALAVLGRDDQFARARQRRRRVSPERLLVRVGTAITLGVETHPPVNTVRAARSRKPVDALRQPRRCPAKPRAARTSWPRWRARATRRNSSSARREPLPGPVSREAGRVGRARALLDVLVDSQEK